MTADLAARRYASALYNVASKSGQLALAGRNMADLHAMLAGHTELRRVLESRSVPPATKQAIVQHVISAAGAMGPEVGRLVSMLGERDRLMMLGSIAEAFAVKQRTADRVTPAEVVTASPLGATRTAALAAALGRVTGGTVTVTERVDPSLIGGLIAKLGGVVFDGSVRRQLERMREQLLAKA